MHQQSMFLAKIRKIKKKNTELFHFFTTLKSLYITWACFRNAGVVTWVGLPAYMFVSSLKRSLQMFHVHAYLGQPHNGHKPDKNFTVYRLVYVSQPRSRTDCFFQLFYIGQKCMPQTIVIVGKTGSPQAFRDLPDKDVSASVFQEFILTTLNKKKSDNPKTIVTAYWQSAFITPG